MWELDCKEGWAPKNWCFWIVVLEKTLESCLDCKIKPISPKGHQPWMFTGKTDTEAEAPILWLPNAKSQLWKNADAGKDWGPEEKRVTEDETVRPHLCYLTGEGNGNPLQCSCLENPRGGGAWWAAVYGITQSRTQLNWLGSGGSSSSMLFNGHESEQTPGDSEGLEAWCATVHGVAKSQTRLGNLTTLVVRTFWMMLLNINQ